MRRVTSFLTIEFFLICSLGADPAIAQSSFPPQGGRTGQPVNRLTLSVQTHLRPPSGIASSKEIQSALDGGEKKTPPSYRRRTDEEVKIAYLFTRFDTLHGEIDRVTTLLTRLKGKVTEEEEGRMQLEFTRLLETLKALSKELPPMDTLPKEFTALQAKNKELAKESRALRQEILKAHERKEDDRLTQLNTEITQKLWLRSWIELELAYSFFTDKKNPTAALALLIGVRNRMADLQTEYWWRRVRKVIGQKITHEMLEDWFKIPVEVTYVGDYDIKLSEKGEVTIYRRHWRKRTIPTAGGEMVSVNEPEVTAFKFQDMPTALRSEIHIVMSQGEAYRGVLHALSNLQHLLLRMKQQKEKREAMPKKELQAALEITYTWAHRGIASDLRRRALPDLENGAAYLEKELYEDAMAALERAKQKLRHALKRQETTGERTRARALVFLNEWRFLLENRERLVAGVKEALEHAHPKNPLEFIRRLETLRQGVFRTKPRLLALQEVYNRFNQTFVLLRRASELLAKKERAPKEERQIYSLSNAAKKNLRLMLGDLERDQNRKTARDGAEQKEVSPEVLAFQETLEIEFAALLEKWEKDDVENLPEHLEEWEAWLGIQKERFIRWGRGKVIPHSPQAVALQPLVEKFLELTDRAKTLFEAHLLDVKDIVGLSYIQAGNFYHFLLEETDRAVELYAKAPEELRQDYFARDVFYGIRRAYEAQKARDGGRRVPLPEFMAAYERLSQSGKPPDTKMLSEALGMSASAVRQRTNRLGLKRSGVPVSNKEFQKAYRLLTKELKRPPTKEEIASHLVDITPDAARDRARHRGLRLSNHKTTEIESRSAYRRLQRRLKRAPNAEEIAKFLVRGSEKHIRHRSHVLGLELTSMPLASPLSRYRDGLTDEVPPDHIAQLRRASRGALALSLADAELEGFPASLGEVGSKVVVHFERVRGKTRDLIVTFRPVLSDETTEPPHAMRRLIIRDGRIRVEKNLNGPNALHDLRRLRARGINFDALPQYVRRNSPSDALLKVMLFEQRGFLPLWSWFQYSPTTIQKRLNAIRPNTLQRLLNAAERKEEELSQRSTAFNDNIPSLFKEGETPAQLEKIALHVPSKKDPRRILREFERLETASLGTHLMHQRRGMLIPYKQILRELPGLYLIDSEPLLKRALGILGHYGFILLYQNGGVMVLDTPFPANTGNYPSASARDGADRQADVLTRQLEEKFGQGLERGDETVIQDIVTYRDSLPPSTPTRQLLYEWLQHHESALAAKAIAAMGLNWPGVVSKLLDVIEGKRDGNPHAAARQLDELVSEGRYGGLVAPLEVIEEAKDVWHRHSGFSKLLAPIKFPSFPTPLSEKPGVLVLVRHGETTWSEAVLNKWAGWHDAKVTEKGRKEAYEAGERIKVEGLHFDQAYSSDLSRAEQTLLQALAAVGQTDIPIVHDKTLRERNYGDMIGWNRKDVERIFGQDVLKRWRRGYSGNAIRPPGGENLADVQERTVPFLVEHILRDVAEGKNVIVSAHGNSLRSILVSLREQTEGRKLSEEEILSLEVPLSTPIVITFAAEWYHQELWVDQEKRAEDVLGFLTSTRDGAERQVRPLLREIPRLEPALLSP